jgi:integrase
MTTDARRPRRQVLTGKMVAALKRRAIAYFYPDPELPKHGVRVQPNGPPHGFYVVARDAYGKQRWVRICSTAELTIEESRDKARTVIKRLAAGEEPFPPVPVKKDSYRAVAENWLKLHVAKQGLRTRGEIERLLQTLVFPHWGKRDFAGIKRRDITGLLDHIEETTGAWNADHVLAIIRKIANWYAIRDDEYRSPYVAGMRRTRSEARTRERILTDEELRAIWRQAEAGGGTFDALIQMLLLTAQRRGAVVRMKWADITPDGVWEIATEEREKGNAGALKLPEAALAIIGKLPRFSNPYVFAAARGNGALNGFSKHKAAFDRACGVTGWTLHDCRRTARSLMSRAGVASDHAERALGHKLQGVKGVYDRHSYFKEKSDALAKLASLIERLVNPPAANVVPLHEAAQ